MKNEDAQLVNQFLTGNENAFTTLVKKYQKSVHALAWRKIGDFHIAEELTQDTFFKGILETLNVEESEPVRWMALCDCRSDLY